MVVNKCILLLLWVLQQSIHLLRNISSTTSQKNWKNDTPPGGLTEILVYSPDPEVNWPDTSLSVFAKADPKFVLPGNVAIAYPEEKCDIDSVIDANGDAILVSGSVFHVYVHNIKSKGLPGVNSCNFCFCYKGY